MIIPLKRPKNNQEMHISFLIARIASENNEEAKTIPRKITPLLSASSSATYPWYATAVGHPNPIHSPTPVVIERGKDKRSQRNTSGLNSPENATGSIRFPRTINNTLLFPHYQLASNRDRFLPPAPLRIAAPPAAPSELAAHVSFP
jgi:hypothetical protein